MDELYAADAGMAQAILYLKDNGHLEAVPNVTGQSQNYALNSSINGKTVNFNITCVSAGNLTQSIYKITSVANSSSTSKTNIEAYVLTLPFFWTNAVTTNGTIDDNGATIIGPKVPNYPDDKWPFTTQPALNSFYLAQVGPAANPPTFPNPPYPAQNSTAWPADNYTLGTYDVSAPTKPLGPLYRYGDLKTGGGQKGIWSNIANTFATVTGTVYVTGDLDIGAPGAGGGNFTINLNNQTIFAEGDIQIGNKATITGSGCILAEGNIDFKPNLSSSNTDFVFIMSLQGNVYFAPSGNFYGSVAGHDYVQFQPTNYFMLPTEPPTNLNFPMTDLNSLAVRIRTWKISRN